MSKEFPKLITFSEPLHITDSAAINQEIVLAITQGKATMRELTPGEYDLAPESWRRSSRVNYNYNLLVHDDGTATLRLIPKYPDSVTIQLNSNTKIMEAGGKVYQLPDDIGVFQLAQPTHEAGKTIINLFAVVTSGRRV